MPVQKFNGAELRRRREARGIRPEVLAVGVERSSATIHLYEVGRVIPTADMVGRLAAVLDCVPGDLFAEVAEVAS